MKRSIAVLLSLAAPVVLGCSAVQPALKTLAIAFGQDLIASASVNYTRRYAEHVESLLISLARKGTGLDLEPQLIESGYQPPEPDYNRPQPYGYGETVYAEGAEYEGGFEDYESGAYDDYESGAYDDYGAPAGGYDGLALDAAVLVRRRGAATLEALADGDVLRDGGADPARGDLLRFFFSSNRDAYVYVIGIDATGYVAQIFPDPAGGPGNPVAAGREYLLPGGEQWWGLDAQTGVEQVFFVASATPRGDIEDVVNRLLAQPRDLSTNRYAPVRRPAVIATRGLVRVGGAGSPPAANGTELASDTWYSPENASEVVLTRWFVHESGP